MRIQKMNALNAGARGTTGSRETAGNSSSVKSSRNLTGDKEKYTLEMGIKDYLAGAIETTRKYFVLGYLGFAMAVDTTLDEANVGHKVVRTATMGAALLAGVPCAVIGLAFGAVVGMTIGGPLEMAQRKNLCTDINSKKSG